MDSHMQCLMKAHVFWAQIPESMEFLYSLGHRRLDRGEKRVQISDTIIIKIVFVFRALFGF